MAVVCRKLQREDFDKGFIQTLRNLAKIGRPKRKVLVERLREISNNPDYCIIVAELDRQIVGSATLFIERKFIHNCGNVGHIEDVVTRSGFEKRGIASELIKQLIEEARRRKCYKAILNCRDELGSFYEKFGFRFNEREMKLDLTTAP